MSIKYRNSLDIFLAENPKIGENRMLGQLRILTLYKVRELQSIKSRESSWLNTISEKLQELNVFECPDLSALVHSTATISFSCLKRVSISNCPQLQYLFTSFMAKKLMNLEEITIKECESVKEIVAKQGDSTSEAIKFERLNTIVVDSLPSLICFYSDSDTLQLPSLIKVHIWQCPNLKYFSQGAIDAKSFLGVQMSLDTSDDLFFHKDLNATIREMFQQHEFFKSVDKECFSDDHELGAYWHGKVVSQSKWLSNVLILKLDKCTLPYAIPSGILPCLKNLRELEVRYSDKVKGIFEVNDIEIMDTASQLKILTLEGLSELTHVWEKNSPGVPIFQNLQQIVVSDCENLQTLIPASLARNLKELEKLEIEFCDKLQEIVEKEEGIATNVTEKFVFPHLKMLLLYDLPQLTYFCPQTFSLECPALNNLSVLYCNKLELFQRAHSTGEHEGSTSINRLPPTSFLKVISNLKELELDWQQISALSLRFRSGQFAEGLKYLNNFSLFLDTDENEKPILPIEILQKAPNLTEMSIKYSNSLEIFLAKNPKIGESKLLGQLRILTLYEVLGLQSIESQDSSWLNTICEKLQELNVFECPDLTTLVHSTATVSFSCLKKVSISKCSHLQFLFTSLAAKKLMNLEEISVKECESVKEIIAKQGVSTSEAIKFERLNTIVLNSLPSLTDFYSGNDTLQLSSLIKVHLWQCPNLKNFSKGAIDAKSFQGVQKSLDPNDDLFFRQDLNSTIREMFQRQEILKAGYGVYISELHIDVDLQNYVFESLVILKLDKCALQYAIPSSILPFLKNLEELEVQDSDEVEGIFEMNDTEIIETASRLKILTLKGLSELKHVWENNSQGVLIFQNLQQVVVSGCKILQTLFPALLAKNLRELEKLEIESCDKLHEIVEKEEGTATNVTEKFVFPHLKMLNLYELPQLAHFYPQTFTMECPALNNLSVLDCNKLKLFESAHSKGKREGSTSINRLPSMSFLKVISNLKELKLDWQHILALSLRFRSEQFTGGLKYLNKISLFLNTDENEKPILPIEILRKAPNLTEMSIKYRSSPDIFLVENPKIGEDRMLGQLRILTLYKVHELQSIKPQDSSWLNTISEKLHELYVCECPDLSTLVHSTATISFSCLKKLSISNCPQLQYLFTSFMAKKLMNLEEITIKECESVKEIIAKPEDSTSEAIKFEWLNTIVLDSLPSLICFYSGGDTLQLSSLIKVHIWQCPRMKYFSQGGIDAKSFVGVQMSLNPNDDLFFHEDLNATIREMFQQEVQGIGGVGIQL